MSNTSNSTYRVRNDERNSNILDNDDAEATVQHHKRRRMVHQNSLRQNRSLFSQQPIKMKPPKEREKNPIIHSFKRPRRVTFGSLETVQSKSTLLLSSERSETRSTNKDLWTTLYQPKLSKDLVVATKKLHEIQQWMQSHDVNIEKSIIENPIPILILVGSPGIGKSTAVRCLASEMNFNVLEWTESVHGDGSSITGSSDEYCNNSPLNSFEHFLYKAGSYIKPLTMSRTTTPSLSTSRGGINKLILMDELPYTHTMDAQQRLQQIITSHIRQPTNVVPIIFICSNTAEGKVQYSDLERYIHPQILYSKIHCQVIVINPPTKPKFRNAMIPIITNECTIRKRSLKQYNNNTFLDELHERSNGDVRFAITTLQYEMIGDDSSMYDSKRCTSISKKPAITGDYNQRRNQNHRDTKLSPFHALGKLLYAKRSTIQQQPTKTLHDKLSVVQQRPPLEFDPDDVIRQSDMELGNILHFLSYHAIDFYTDIEELSAAMCYFSDSSFVSNQHYISSSTSTNSVSLSDIGTSLAGRIVAHTNMHPAPHTFRALTAPKVYEMIRKRRDNEERIEKVCQHQWLLHHGNINITNRTNSSTFAVDLLPFIRVIEPDNIVGSASFFDSYFRTTTTPNIYSQAVLSLNSGSSQHDVSILESQEAMETLELIKEQAEILLLDDIVEDNDVDDGW